MVQVVDRPRRRTSTGPSRRPSERNVVKHESAGFDPFDASNTETVNSFLDSKNDGEWPGDAVDAAFDPFGIDSEKKQKKTERGAPKTRRAPGRSHSSGTLGALSKADLAGIAKEREKKKESKDDDLEFEAIDWEKEGEAAPPKRSSKGKSRRHSMDSRPGKGYRDNDNDSVDSSPFDKSSSHGDKKDKEKKKKRSGKTRRASLDSALSFPQEDTIEDGFGPVKTFGFEQPAALAPADRRKGMTRSKSGSCEMSISSWKSGSEEVSRVPKRVINRRRSADTSSSRDTDGFSLRAMAEHAYDTETTATQNTTTTAEFEDD